MNTETTNQEPVTSAPSISATKSRWMGFLVIGVIAAPMIAAYAIYKSGMGIPTSTVNKGDLLPQAQSISPLLITDTSGQSIDLITQKKKWRLIIPVTSNCSDACVSNLYTSRQVHIRLGEKARRVERIVLMQSVSQSESVEEYLHDDHPRLIRAVAEASTLRNLLSSEIDAGRDIYQRYYLMDQEGFIMMSYGTEHTGGDLLKDIKRMLKYSYQEG